MQYVVIIIWSYFDQVHLFKSDSTVTTNPTERSSAATERLTSESDLESFVESNQALAKQWPSKSVSARRVLGGIL